MRLSKAFAAAATTALASSGRVTSAAMPETDARGTTPDGPADSRGVQICDVNLCTSPQKAGGDPFPIAPAAPSQGPSCR